MYDLETVEPNLGAFHLWVFFFFPTFPQMGEVFLHLWRKAFSLSAEDKALVPEL